MKKLTATFVASCLISNNANAEISVDPYISLDFNYINSTQEVDSSVKEDEDYYMLESYVLTNSKQIAAPGISLGTKISMGSLFVSPELFYLAQDKQTSENYSYNVTIGGDEMANQTNQLTIKHGDEYGANLKFGYSGTNNAIYAITGVEKQNVTIKTKYTDESSVSESISLDDIQLTYGLGISNKIHKNITASLEYKITKAEDYNISYSLDNGYSEQDINYDGKHTDNSLSFKLAYFF